MTAGQPSVGRYIYAIVEEPVRAGALGDGFPWGRNDLGFDGRPVYAILRGGVAAAVSDVPDRAMRPERRNLATHYDVLKRLMGRMAILPMSFGTIADGAEAVREFLDSHQEMLRGQLRRVADRVEMSLRVSWNVPNIFEHFVNAHADLRELRDRLFGDGREPLPQEKIELGRLFERTLRRERALRSRSVAAALRPCCVEIQEAPSRDEREVMSLTCLIERNAQAEFEQSVFEAARGFDDTHTFDISGPFPPHSFVHLDLRASPAMEASHVPD